MTEEQKNKIIQDAFIDEIEKNAQAQLLPGLFKFLSRVGKFTSKFTKGKMLRYADEGLHLFESAGGKAGQGVEALSDYVKAFRPDKIVKGGTGFIPNESKYLSTDVGKKFVEDNAGWLQHQLAEKGEMVSNLKQGPGAVLKGYRQEFTDATYKQVTPDSKTWMGLGKPNEFVWKDGKPMLKGQALAPNRPILNMPEGVTQDNFKDWLTKNPKNRFLVKKRILPRAGALAWTTPGMAVTPFALGGLNKDSIKDSLKDSATNYLPGGWEGRILYDAAT